MIKNVDKNESHSTKNTWNIKQLIRMYTIFKSYDVTMKTHESQKIIPIVKTNLNSLLLHVMV